MGAWPADVYYGDVDGIWTDVSVNSTTASPARTQNAPGDGKFDQSVVPGNVELQVGRVDFNGMPSFTLTEQQLLQNYLNKNHEYRKKYLYPISKPLLTIILDILIAKLCRKWIQKFCAFSWAF